MRVALRSIPCLYCVTDSTAAAGMPDGQYRLGRHRVTKCLGGVRLADGTLAGSTLTMDRAFRNVVTACHRSVVDAAHLCSTTAARELNLEGLGAIEHGAAADLVILDRRLSVTQTMIAGELVYDAGR